MSTSSDPAELGLTLVRSIAGFSLAEAGSLLDTDECRFTASCVAGGDTVDAPPCLVILLEVDEDVGVAACCRASPLSAL